MLLYNGYRYLLLLFRRLYTVSEMHGYIIIQL